jgi:hypothetical protein
VGVLMAFAILFIKCQKQSKIRQLSHSPTVNFVVNKQIIELSGGGKDFIILKHDKN